MEYGEELLRKLKEIPTGH